MDTTSFVGAIVQKFARGERHDDNSNMHTIAIMGASQCFGQTLSAGIVYGDYVARSGCAITVVLMRGSPSGEESALLIMFVPQSHCNNSAIKGANSKCK